MKKLLVFVLVIFVSLFQVGIVRALEIEITGNGSESDSQVSITQESQISVVQENTSNVTNQVDVNSNTGENSTDTNTNADASIVTGDVNSQVGIENTLNTSVAEVGCCSTPSDVDISGNGSGSTNNVALNQSNTTSVFVTQNANVVNNISGSANTGRNSANYNSGGDIYISTGDIKAISIIENTANLASAKLLVGVPSLNAIISENGTDSTNAITANFDFDNFAFTNHSANFLNFSVWDLNTGENSANGNTDGDITIETGDIDFTQFIKNFANLSEVEIECCEVKPDDPDDPDDPGEPVTPPTGNGGNGGNGGGGSSDGGSAGAAGPSVLGLSDTTSKEAQTLFFFLGLVFIALGAKITYQEAFKKSF